MRRLLVVGAGGHGKVVADCARRTECWTRIDFIDDSVPAGTFVGGTRVLGTTEQIESLAGDDTDLIVAFGDNAGRTALIDRLELHGTKLVSIVHPEASVSDTVEIGSGTVVLARAAINADAVVGTGCIINTGAVVEHDCVLERGVHICPNASLAGGVTVGECAWVGIGSQVIQQLRIGAGSTVGAGATVIEDVADEDTVVGVPAHSTKCPEQAQISGDGHAGTTGWPYHGEDELRAVIKVLASGRTNYWTGQEACQFESEFAAYVGCGHAVAVANGTVALELALHAAGIGPGDEVIVPSRTFIASASAVAMRGAKPIVADVELDSQNLSARTVAPLITERTRAIIAVHHAGWPCDMQPLMALVEQHQLTLIEDCAQAHGARYRDRAVGSFGRIAAFSFCQDKIITTGGEGGMLVTDDEELWQRAWAFKDHGKNYGKTRQPPSPGYRLVHDEFGTNWRLTESQAAIGRCQLQKLDDWVVTRRRNASQLEVRLKGMPGLRIPDVPSDCFHSYYLYYAHVDPDQLRPGWDRAKIMTAVNKAGVWCMPGSSPEIYREQAFEAAGLQPAQRLPNAVSVGATSLVFRVHPMLGYDSIERTADVVATVMSDAAG